MRGTPKIAIGLVTATPVLAAGPVSGRTMGVEASPAYAMSTELAARERLMAEMLSIDLATKLDLAQDRLPPLVLAQAPSCPRAGAGAQAAPGVAPARQTPTSMGCPNQTAQAGAAQGLSAACANNTATAAQQRATQTVTAYCTTNTSYCAQAPAAPAGVQNAPATQTGVRPHIGAATARCAAPSQTAACVQTQPAQGAPALQSGAQQNATC